VRCELKEGRKEIMACQRNTETSLAEEEPTSVDMKPEAAQQYDVPKEDAEMMPIGGPKKRRMGRKLAAERQGKPKERNQGKDGRRKKFAVARRGTTGRAKVALCMENAVGKVRARDNVVRGAPKERTLGRRHQPRPECKSGIKDLGSKTIKMALELQFVKRATTMFGGVAEGEKLDAVEVSAPSGATK
jgi:hypothetical protein